MSSSDDEDVPTLVAADDTSIRRPDASAPEVKAPAEAQPHALPQSISPPQAPVPISILTGWLGAGKTTLVQHILKSMQGEGKKIAIINNEAGATGVEDSLLITGENEAEAVADLVELGNGCVCCSVRSDFVLALEGLLKQRQFDYIIVECSGMANPGPLASLFWLDEELESNVYLDGILAVADAKHILGHLANSQPHSQQVVLQLAFADRIILNKKDLVSSDDMVSIKRKVASINPSAHIEVTQHSSLPLDRIMNIHAFEMRNVEALSKLNSKHHEGHNHGSSEPCNEGCLHDRTIASLVVEDLRPDAYVDLQAFKRWVAHLLWAEDEKDFKMTSQDRVTMAFPEQKQSKSWAVSDRPVDTPNLIFRCKAILNVKGAAQKYFLQGVQDLWSIEPGSRWAQDEPRVSRVVFIGRNLDEAALREGFGRTLLSQTRT